jgi:hypothetical protein
MISMQLEVDFCSKKAAIDACRRFHYNPRFPKSKIAPLGVWESGTFIGAVIFGRGACSQMGSPFGLDHTEVCELLRVALDDHKTPVSQILSLAIRKLREHSPGLKLIVSFADSAQGHIGTIYKASSFLYMGAQSYHALRIHGEVRHPRAIHCNYGGVGAQSIAWLRRHVDPKAERILTPPKHKYVKPLTRRMRKTVLGMALPYPKKLPAEPRA